MTEPSNGELGRRLDDTRDLLFAANDKLDRLPSMFIGREEFKAWMEVATAERDAIKARVTLMEANVEGKAEKGEVESVSTRASWALGIVTAPVVGAVVLGILAFALHGVHL